MSSSTLNINLLIAKRWLGNMKRNMFFESMEKHVRAFDIQPSGEYWVLSEHHSLSRYTPKRYFIHLDSYISERLAFMRKYSP